MPLPAEPRDVVRLPLLEGSSALAPRSGQRAASQGAASQGAASQGAASQGTTSPDKLLQVGELARAAGKTVRAIHHYEELGLLKPDGRSKGRFRLYDPAAVTRVRWIGKLHDLGMSLSQIQKVVEAWESAPTPARAMADVRSMYRARLEETRSQIAHLQTLERELVASVRYLDTCDSCDPDTLLGEATPPPRDDEPAAACGACQLREREAEPDLVAGIVAG